jgi:hypothetical protein
MLFKVNAVGVSLTAGHYEFGARPPRYAMTEVFLLCMLLWPRRMTLFASLDHEACFEACLFGDSPANWPRRMTLLSGSRS